MTRKTKKGKNLLGFESCKIKEMKISPITYHLSLIPKSKLLTPK